MTFLDSEHHLDNLEEAEPGLPEPHQQQAALIAEIGHSNTTMALFDVAVSSYRLIAAVTVPTTVGPPWENVMVGVRQAVKYLAEVTGRTLLSKRGTLLKPTRRDGSGVDNFTAVISAAPPLKTILVGLDQDVSLSSGRRAMRHCYVDEVDCLSLADGRQEQAQIRTILDHKPDLIFMVGGTNGGAEKRLLRLIETVNLGIGALAKVKKPQLLFAGNIKLRESITRLFDGGSNQLHLADNIRPEVDKEQIQDAASQISDLYNEVKSREIPGMQTLRDWSSLPVMSTSRATSHILQFLAALQKQRVFCLDLGSSSLTIALADADNVTMSVRSDLGMGRPITNLLQIVPSAEIARWLPGKPSPEEIHNYIYNKSVHPNSIPYTERTLTLEQAAAREILRVGVQSAFKEWGWTTDKLPPFGILIARGGILTNGGLPSQIILMILDAVQPEGMFAVGLDQQGVLPALGVLAQYNPLMVVQALEAGILNNLGWVVAPTGRGRTGQTAVTVEMDSGVKDEVAFGSISVLTLPPGESTKVTITPGRRFDIGLGPGIGKSVTLFGGPLSLVVDARGRPLNLPSDSSDREDVLRQWLWDVGG